MKKKKIVIIGGGGHAKVLIELIQEGKYFNIIGIIDPHLPESHGFSGIPILGDDLLLPRLFSQGVKHVAIGVGSVKTRKLLYLHMQKIGFTIPPLIHPYACIAKTAMISAGVQVMMGAIIQSDVSIGENTIINTGAQIDHDCKIGKHVHIAPGVVLSGGVCVGDETFIGAGSTVIQKITIGEKVFIGAGSVVTKNVH